VRQLKNCYLLQADDGSFCNWPPTPRVLTVSLIGRGLAADKVVELREARTVALEARSRRFAVDVVRMCHSISAASVLGDMARQLRRAANSVAVNHRAVRRARSLKEFAAKLQIVNEEVDEAVYWLEVMVESGLAPNLDFRGLIEEGRELRAIFAAARRTTRTRLSTTRGS